MMKRQAIGWQCWRGIITMGDTIMQSYNADREQLEKLYNK
jgi:hypothetical protein